VAQARPVAVDGLMGVEKILVAARLHGETHGVERGHGFASPASVDAPPYSGAPADETSGCPSGNCAPLRWGRPLAARRHIAAIPGSASACRAGAKPPSRPVTESRASGR